MFRTLCNPDTPRGTVYWFCHAGAGPASLMRYARTIDSSLRVEAATLCGREERYQEGMKLSLDETVNQFSDLLLDKTDGPFALVGHSFGSLLSFLITRRLIANGLTPDLLVAMTLAAPDRLPSIPKMSQTSDEEFLNYIEQRFDGVPEALRQNPEALGLFLPIVRYDMSMLESYIHSDPLPVGVPMIAIGGTQDAAVSRSDLAAWKEFTTESFSLKMMPGDHFFAVQRIAKIIDLVGRNIGQR